MKKLKKFQFGFLNRLEKPKQFSKAKPSKLIFFSWENKFKEIQPREKFMRNGAKNIFEKIKIQKCAKGQGLNSEGQRHTPYGDSFSPFFFFFF